MTSRLDPPRHPPAALFLTCPRCGKRTYATKAAAKAARREMGDRTLHLYRCAQGNLHLGHQAPGASREIYRARAAAQDRANPTDTGPTADVVLSARARRDIDHYRASATERRASATTYRLQALGATPARAADLERDALAADVDAARWDALADELDALEPAGVPAGQDTLL